MDELLATLEREVLAWPGAPRSGTSTARAGSASASTCPVARRARTSTTTAAPTSCSSGAAGRADPDPAGDSPTRLPGRSDRGELPDPERGGRARGVAPLPLERRAAPGRRRWSPERVRADGAVMTDGLVGSLLTRRLAAPAGALPGGNGNRPGICRGGSWLWCCGRLGRPISRRRPWRAPVPARPLPRPRPPVRPRPGSALGAPSNSP